MNQGKRSRKRTKRTGLIVALVLALLAVAAVGATVAYLTRSSDPVENTFTIASSNITIEEEVEDGVKSEVKIVNNGDMPVYVRAAVIANTVDESGAITGAADVSASLCGEGWVKGEDGYFYYTKPVAPAGETENLLSSNISLEGIQVTILAEAIQSQPADAVKEAWGVDPSTLGDN